MLIGKMKYQIRIDSYTTTTAPSGQELTNWVAGLTYFAGLEWIDSDEKEEANQKVSSRKAKFTIHNVVSVNEMQRVYYNSQYYEILSVTLVEGDRQIELVCRVKDNGNVS